MSNPAMIALIGANLGLAAMSRYRLCSYTGSYRTQEDIGRDSQSVEKLANPLVFIGFILLLILMAVCMTTLILLMKGHANERDNQYAAMEKKCVDRGGKLVYARRAGIICVIDIDKEIK